MNESETRNQQLVRELWIVEIKDDQVCHLREYLDTAYIMSVAG
jgi:hypothetical protein